MRHAAPIVIDSKRATINILLFPPSYPLHKFELRVASMPQPLPNNPFPAGTPARQAYTTCLTLEASFPLVNWSGPPTVVCARLLGYLIVHAPTIHGRTDVANEINSCNNDEEKLHVLAQFYINHFLRVCE